MVKCGVPQGSILGPLLFCIFINDLPLSIESKSTSCSLLADDGTLTTSNKEIEQIRYDLQLSLDNVHSWCSSNGMALNAQKTKTMLISTRQKYQNKDPLLKLTIEASKLKQVTEYKLLGITVDNHLTWQNHLAKISKTISCNLFALSKLKDILSGRAKKAFFHAHILSHINYISNVWDNCAENHMKLLKSVHKRGIKLISSVKDQSYQVKCSKLHLLTLEKQLKLNKCNLVHRIIHRKAGTSYLANMFSLHANHRSSRQSMSLQLPKPRIDLYKSSLAFSGSQLWNSLPNTLKEINSFHKFKQSLLKYLFDSS